MVVNEMSRILPQSGALGAFFFQPKSLRPARAFTGAPRMPLSVSLARSLSPSVL